MPPKTQMKKRKTTTATMRKPHFFKVLLGDFMQHLRIPPKFLKHISAAGDEEQPKAKRAILEGPSGSNWRVAVARTPGDAFLTTGWGKFARDHSLREHEFLVFRYDGDMHFTVLIFDTTACLREDAFAVRPWRKPTPCQDGRKRGRPRRLERGGAIKEEAVEHGLSLEEFMKRDGHETNPLQIQPFPAPTSAVTIKHHGHETNPLQIQPFPAPPSAVTIKRDGHEFELPVRSNRTMSKGQNSYYVSTRRAVTVEERMKVQAAASSFTSAFPYIVLHMMASQVYRPTVRIPNKFSRDHLPLKRSSLVLRDPDGNSWITTYIPGSRNQISRGWSAFARANRLEEGDYCVFEVVGPVELRVHIFRAVDEAQPIAMVATK